MPVGFHVWHAQEVAAVYKEVAGTRREVRRKHDAHRAHRQGVILQVDFPRHSLFYAQALVALGPHRAATTVEPLLDARAGGLEGAALHRGISPACSKNPR
jgi:hypothetical protein